MAKWDWYATTVHGRDPDEVIGEVASHFELVDVAPGRGRFGFEHGVQIVRGEHVLVECWWGGQNKGVHVVGTGENSPAVADAVSGFPHRPTRVDSAEDFIEEGLFDRLADYLLRFADENGIRIHQAGDWYRTEERQNGRTIYLGSPQSAAQLVMYEKGFQLGGDPNWVRLEVRARPKGDDAKGRVSQWVPAEAFGAAGWLHRALQGFGWDHLQRQAIGTVWRPSDTDRARLAMIRQYGPTLAAWADEAGGWDALADILRESVQGEPVS